MNILKKLMGSKKKGPKLPPLPEVTREIHTGFIHCSASNHAHHDDISVINKWHLDRGWKGVGYHDFIKFDGTVQPGRDVNDIPAAQKGHNTGSYAICVHGGQDGTLDAFTEEQFEALRARVAQIDKAYGPLRWRGHQEVANKACPVFDYAEVLDLDLLGYVKK